MNLPFHWRISLWLAALTLALLSALGVYVNTALVRQGTDDARQELLGQAKLSLRALPSADWRAGPALQAAVGRIDADIQARVTLIDPDGKVLADSRSAPELMEDHADRPERLEALDRGEGSAIRPSATLGKTMLYVAITAGPDQPAGTVTRLARPLDAVEASSARLRAAMLLTVAITVIVALVATAWLSRALTAPVQEMVRVAHRVERGDLMARVRQPGGGELTALADVLNRALDRSAELLTESQRQTQYYAAVLEQMTDAVVVVDQRGRVQFANAAFGRAFGVDVGQLQAPRLEEVAISYELSALLTRAVEQGTTQRAEVRISSPQERILEGVASALKAADGRIAGAVGLLHDITELRRMDQVRRDFVANASHELRTPAAGIRALAEVLQSGAAQDPEKGPRFLGQILDSAERLGQILDDMLILTRVERGQELLHTEWQSAPRALSAALAHVQAMADSKKIALHLQSGPDDRVFADAPGLQTMLINLLDNAVKYTPDGGRVDVMGRAVPGGYECAVTDTGLGIPPEDLERIFERFYRVNKARDRASGGTGLGLSIVKHIAEIHGGKVTVRSAVGAGSTFTLFLPQTSLTQA